MPHEDTREQIAAEVRAEMARQNKIQTELGAVLGLPQQSISQRMNGKVPFRADELATAARWLGVPVSRFMPDEVGVA